MTVRRIGTRAAAVVVCALALSLAPSQASAQANNVELSAGYAFYHEEDFSVPAGWYASGGGFVTNWLGLVGQVSGHYKTITESGIDVKTTMYLLGVGPKFALRSNPRFTPYVQALFGVGRASATASLGGQSFDDESNGFAYQPSAGVEINASSSVGVRVAVGRAGIRVDDEWVGGTTFMTGVVIRR